MSLKLRLAKRLLSDKLLIARPSLPLQLANPGNTQSAAQPPSFLSPGKVSHTVEKKLKLNLAVASSNHQDTMWESSFEWRPFKSYALDYGCIVSHYWQTLKYL